jgi:hypothetical protein
VIVIFLQNVREFCNFLAFLATGKHFYIVDGKLNNLLLPSRFREIEFISLINKRFKLYSAQLVVAFKL